MNKKDIILTNEQYSSPFKLSESSARDLAEFYDQLKVRNGTFMKFGCKICDGEMYIKRIHITEEGFDYPSDWRLVSELFVDNNIHESVLDHLDKLLSVYDDIRKDFTIPIWFSFSHDKITMSISETINITNTLILEVDDEF